VGAKWLSTNHGDVHNRVGVDVHHRQAAFLGLPPNMLVISTARATRFSNARAGSLVDWVTLSPREPRTWQRRNVFRKETSCLSDDRARVCHCHQVVDDHGKAIL
jgi:hypothetical protein